MKQNFLIVFLSLILSISCTTAFAESPTVDESTPVTAEIPEISAAAAILMDAKTGEVLYEKNSDAKMYPASITKLMTVLLALENANLTDSITFSHEAVYSIEPGSAHIAMQEGEVITLEQALYGILLRSANEVSNAVAEHIDGTVTAFASHMTDRAKELGCTNTNFVNANGLFHENHYTTAHDMAFIAQALLQQESYRNMMSTTYYEIPPTAMQEEARYLHGQHQMLNENSIYYYEYATGGKTGFVSEALNTLVTFAKQGDTELIAVVLKCNGAEHYVDTRALFEYGFANYKTIQVLSAANYTQNMDITETYNNKTTTLGTISVAPQADVYSTVPVNTDLTDIQVSVQCPDYADAPVIAGEEVGSLTVTAGGETLTAVPLLAQSSVEATTREARIAQEKAAIMETVKQIGVIVAKAIFAFTVLLCITRLIGYFQRKRRKKRRTALMQQQRRQHH